MNAAMQAREDIYQIIQLLQPFLDVSKDSIEQQLLLPSMKLVFQVDSDTLTLNPNPNIFGEPVIPVKQVSHFTIYQYLCYVVRITDAEKTCARLVFTIKQKDSIHNLYESGWECSELVAAQMVKEYFNHCACNIRVVETSFYLTQQMTLSKPPVVYNSHTRRALPEDIFPIHHQVMVFLETFKQIEHKCKYKNKLSNQTAMFNNSMTQSNNSNASVTH